MQNVVTACVSENRLPTENEIASEAGRLFAIMKGLPLEDPEDRVASKGRGLVNQFDLASAVSRNWAEALVVHRFGDQLSGAQGSKFEDLLEGRMSDITDKLGTEPDYVDLLEWLLERSSQADPSS